MRLSVSRTVLVVLSAAALTTAAMSPAAAEPDDPVASAQLSPLPSSYTAPPAPGGALDDLGVPMSSITVYEGAFGTLPDGTFVAYSAPLGENAALNVSTTTFPTPQPVSLGTYPMQGASGSPILAVSPTDGSVYLATFYEGHLFRWDPATREMHDLGQAVSGQTYLYGLTVAPDGTVYGGTYPDAHVFSYRADTGFVDYGTASPDGQSQYARSTTYDPVHHALYVGLQTSPRVRKLDLDTRTWSDIDLPLPASATAIIDLDYAAGRVFVNAAGSLRVIDTATDTEVPVTDATTGQVTTDFYLAARGVSPERQGGVYFSTVANKKVVLARYDLATNTVQTTDVVSRRGALIGYGWRVENGDDVLYAFAGNYSGGGFRYDIDTGAVGSMQFAVQPSPSPLENVLPSADGSKVYVDAFLNGNAVVYDTAAKTYKPIARLGQVEGWTQLDGEIYAGTYPLGTLLQYDPATNHVTTYTELKSTYQQIRPIEAQTHDGKVYFGTEPDYGERGGAVAIVDPATGSVDVTRGMVPDQTIAAITFRGDDLLLGSSTEGGTGTEPIAGSGHVVQWDPATKQVLRDVVPVPGARSVNALVTGPHGAVFGLADGTLFELDPATLQVVRTLEVGGAGNASDGVLTFHPNGYLYAETGGSTYVIDALAFTSTRVASSTSRLELSADGSLYTLVRPDGFTNFLHLGRYVPDATDCATPDTTPEVTLFGTATGVRNRFLSTGCTLQDLFPTKPSGDASYAGTVNPWLDRLEAQGVISAQERDALWEAAKAGR